jgi:hypothetical protein
MALLIALLIPILRAYKIKAGLAFNQFRQPFMIHAKQAKRAIAAFPFAALNATLGSAYGRDCVLLPVRFKAHPHKQPYKVRKGKGAVRPLRVPVNVL